MGGWFTSPPIRRPHPALCSLLSNWGKDVTKAKRILELYERAIGTMPETQLPKFIAAQIGTSDSYVRTVARQRLGHRSEADRRYALSPLGRQRDRRYYRKRLSEARAS
jgi:hypothetical protein